MTATQTMNIVDYLAGKNVRTWKASGDEITAHCIFCGRHQRDKGRLYINTAEGVYYCQVCQEAGTYRQILEHFGDPVSTVPTPGSEDMLARRRILNAATDVAEQGLTSNDDVMLWLMGNDRVKRQRGLRPETILEARLGFIGQGWSLVRSLKIPHEKEQLLGTGLVYREDTEYRKKGDDFFRGPKVLIPYLSSGNCVQIRGRDWTPTGEGKYQTGPGEAVRLYGTDDLRGATEAIIVEGEFDRLVLKQALTLSMDPRFRKMAVVALPGAGSWQKAWSDYFRDCRRVFVALDPDQAGQTGSIKIKEDLGTRARVVTLPDDLPKCDWTEYLVYRKHSVKDVERLLNDAASEGRRLGSFSEAHDDFLAQEVSGEAYPTGYTMVDQAIDGGGMKPGSVTIIAAKTSVGKTLFTSNIIVNQCRQGLVIPTLFLSLEMTRAELAERMVRQWRFFHPYADDNEIRNTFDEVVMICDKNRLQGRDVAALIEEYEEERGHKPKQVVLDYLGYFARGMQGRDQYEKTTNAIMESKALAKDAGVAMIVPTQVNRNAKDGMPIDSETMRDSGAVEETADYIFGLWRPDDALDSTNQTERTGHLNGWFCKNRRGAKYQPMVFRYAPASLAIVDPCDAKAAFAATQEARLVGTGKTYADILAMNAQAPLPGLQVVGSS